jgi:hypothetical protein
MSTIFSKEHARLTLRVPLHIPGLQTCLLMRREANATLRRAPAEGDAYDAVVGRWIAIATARDLLDRIRETLEATYRTQEAGKASDRIAAMTSAAATEPACAGGDRAPHRRSRRLLACGELSWGGAIVSSRKRVTGLRYAAGHQPDLRAPFVCWRACF